MRLGVHIPCYKLTHFLPAVLHSVSHLDRILVTNSNRPWDDESQQEDDTEAICHASGIEKIELVKGNWSQDSEHLQRNMACRILSDCDFIYLLDSDEIMTLEDQRRLLEFALSNPGFAGYAVNTIPYFNDLEHVALYDQGNTPLALIRPEAKFFITRCIENPWIYCKDVSIHHFKFLQPKKDIGWRVKAKHSDQQREFGGIVPCEKNLELERFMMSCGYTSFKSELKESEIKSA